MMEDNNSQAIVYRFQGTKDQFLERLSAYPFSYDTYYVKRYLVKVSDDEFCFGIERSGHSDGFWFVSKMVEHDTYLEFVGTIQFVAKNRSNRTMKFSDWFSIAILMLLMLPLLLVLSVCYGIVWCFSWCVKKLFKFAILKTQEEKLCELMEKYLTCKRVSG